MYGNSRQDNEDRKRKSKAMAIFTLNPLYRPVSSIQYDQGMVSSSLLIKMCFSLYIILTSKLNPNCNSDGNNKRQFEPNSEPNSEESSDGPQVRETGKQMTFPKKGIYYHYCHHVEDKAHLCVYILCCECFEVKKQKEEQASENESTRTSKHDKKAKKDKLAEEWSRGFRLEPRKKCDHETSELKGQDNKAYLRPRQKSVQN